MKPTIAVSILILACGYSIAADTSEDKLLLTLAEIGYEVSVTPSSQILIDPHDGLPYRAEVFYVAIGYQGHHICRYSGETMSSAIVGAVQQLIKILTLEPELKKEPKYGH